MKLLLIEDNPTMQATLQRSFERRGIQVATCSDGLRAVDRWLASVPDVVLLDLTLPGLDGLEVLARARAAGLATPVIILTARGTVGDRILGQKAGALHLAAEPAERLLVEDGDEAARHCLIDDEANRVRTDVDDGDAGSALARSLHDRGPLWGLLALVTASEPARRRFLERLSTARQTRIRHEIVVQVEGLFAFRGLHTR